MEYLKRKGYIVISLDEAIEPEFPAQRKKREKYVVLTFDDGYKDFLANAYPVLLEYHYPCVVYLVPGHIETGKVFWWDKDLGESRLMNWKDVMSLQYSGIVQFGSHTMTHTDLDRPDEDEVRDELVLSKETLQKKLKIEIKHFSYPRGIVTKYARELVRTLYKTGVTIFDGKELMPDDRNLDLSVLKRLPVQRSDGRHLFRARLNNWLIAEEWLKKVMGRH
jgi:peptidoglycan/xylan/chitin deacetylase (PgdA/CDA1 family)